MEPPAASDENTPEGHEGGMTTTTEPLRTTHRRPDAVETPPHAG